MTNTPLSKDVQVWLEKVEEDLRWADYNQKGDFWAQTCFACQQAVEKILKAYLIHKDHRLYRIHKLGQLLRLCAKHDKQFSQWKISAETISKYYIDTRYPDFISHNFTQEQATDALKNAREIATFTKSKLC